MLNVGINLTKFELRFLHLQMIYQIHEVWMNIIYRLIECILKRLCLHSINSVFVIIITFLMCNYHSPLLSNSIKTKEGILSRSLNYRQKFTRMQQLYLFLVNVSIASEIICSIDILKMQHPSTERMNYYKRQNISIQTMN